MIGHLIETHGYYGTGETLPIGDTEEGWVIEMAPSPEGKGGLWVAKKVADGEVFVAANELRIREVDPDDPNMLYCSSLHTIAEKHGWWKPEDGKLGWLRTVSSGEYSHLSTCYVPFYAGITSIAAPYYTCDTSAFSQKSAWWAFNFVANWAGLKYSYMIKEAHRVWIRM